MAHWHSYNPWADKLVYVPDLLELAKAQAIADDPDHSVIYWLEYGPKLDAYILPSPSGQHSAGIRYGKEGNEYLSLYVNYNRVQELLLKYGPKEPS